MAPTPATHLAVRETWLKLSMRTGYHSPSSGQYSCVVWWLVWCVRVWRCGGGQGLWRVKQAERRTHRCWVKSVATSADASQSTSQRMRACEGVA
jgi:hypothetical protein